MSRPYHHPKSWLIATSAILLSGMAWLSLFAPGSGGLIELCGSDGVFAYVVPWDAGRLLGLAAMWGAMLLAMLGPCVAKSLVLTGWEVRRSYGQLTGALCHGLGYFGSTLPVIVIAAAGEWALESLGIVAAGAPPQQLLTIIGLFVAGVILMMRPRSFTRELPGPFGRGVSQAIGQLPRVLGMVCLQLAGGSMNLTWMLALASWMWAAEFLPLRLRRARRAETVLPSVR